MKTLTYNIPNDLGSLHQELIEGVPNFHRTYVGEDGVRTGSPDCAIVEGRDGFVRLTVSDDTDEGAIQAIIDAHDATPVVSRVEVLTAKLQDDSITFTEMKELMRLKG